MNPWRPNEVGNGRTVRLWAIANLLANIGIIGTGGLVRLTGSGLGCPTWPKCTPESFVPQSELGWHGVIEFGNRLLTYVLIAIVIGTTIAVWRWQQSTQRMRSVAVFIAAAIPLQGVIGGITVLTDLNPWIVAGHLMLSMLLVSASTWLVLAIRAIDQPGRRPGALPVAIYALTWLVIYLGTIVTGAGPHAGDADAPRNGLNPELLSHVHAAAVYVLLAVTCLCVLVSRRNATGKAAAIVLAVQLGQALIGIVQYYSDLPIALVAAHLLGAAALMVVTTRLVVIDASVRRRSSDNREPINSGQS